MSGLVSAAIVGSITYIISILIVATAKAAPVNKKVDDKGREQGKRKGKKYKEEENITEEEWTTVLPNV